MSGSPYICLSCSFAEIQRFFAAVQGSVAEMRQYYVWLSLHIRFLALSPSSKAFLRFCRNMTALCLVLHKYVSLAFLLRFEAPFQKYRGLWPRSSSIMSGPPYKFVLLLFGQDLRPFCGFAETCQHYVWFSICMSLLLVYRDLRLLCVNTGLFCRDATALSLVLHTYIPLAM